MLVKISPASVWDEYERLMTPARERFALSENLQTLQLSTDGVFLDVFLLQFCSLGVQMTRPVERWIRRAAERCEEVGMPDIARALARHAKSEAGHHLMMIADVASLTSRWNTRGYPSVNADELLGQEPSAGVMQYCKVHEDNIAGETPFAQIAIQYEIEMLPERFGETFISRCIEILGPEIIPCLSFVTEHIKLDVAHTKLNAALLVEMLERNPESISALVRAGTVALDAYATFLADCVRLAKDKSGQICRPMSDTTPSSTLSWLFRAPCEMVAHEGDSLASGWIAEVRSFRGSVLFENGRRPHFQKQEGTLTDIDPVDAHAHHVLAYSSGSLVGCARVYRLGISSPPCLAETLLGTRAFMLMLEKLGVQRSNVVEIGRWTVDPNHRSFGWLAAQLAARSAALASTLGSKSGVTREIVLCSVGTADRQDAMLRRIGLIDVPDLNPIYCANYNDSIRLLFCAAVDDLSPAFRRLVMQVTECDRIIEVDRGVARTSQALITDDSTDK